MAYGLEIYNASGNTVLSYTSRVTRFVQYGTVTVSASSSSDVTVVGMENNDSWDVFLDLNASTWATLVGGNTITVTLNTGFFTITNLRTSSSTVTYWVLRT